MPLSTISFAIGLWNVSNSVVFFFHFNSTKSRYSFFFIFRCTSYFFILYFVSCIRHIYNLQKVST